jgi:hypothetical protein
MKSNIAYLASLLSLYATASMAQAGFEQYYYLQRNMPPAVVPIIQIQNEYNWYAEVRYNYEEKDSFSAYGGKTFSHTSGLLEYSYTPIIGGVIGRFKGGSLGLDTSLDYKNLFFTAETQLTFSFNNHYSDFFFGWYDLGYSPLEWLWFGWSLQQTLYTLPQDNLMESGLMIGFNVGNWTFPVYMFNMFDTNPYVVLGITHVLDLTNK